MPHHDMSWPFMFNGLRWKVVVCFVDNGGIVDNHCLNFLFMIVTRTFIKHVLTVIIKEW